MIGKDFYGKDRWGNMRHWFVLSEDTPENGEKLFFCCLYYQRKRKWWRKGEKMVMRMHWFFTEKEITPC